jgi:ABC-type multidrug transport system ATPase subunit
MAERLSKAYGMRGWALAGVSLVVAQGEFFGLVGPHGAGKTTLVKILATINRPDGGRASIGGQDVATAFRRIRPVIGYMSQSLGLDERLTGRENVRMMARLYGLSRRDADKRTEQVLAQLELTAVGDCRVAQYATGARKRLALARALVHRPSLLLVDDPTAGVPAHDQAAIWHSLRNANQMEDVTVFLTTQRAEEAEGMCHRVAIIDGGKLLAAGTPAELKAQVTGATVTIRLALNGRIPGAALVLERVQGVRDIRLHADRLELEVASAASMPLLLRLLEEHEITVRDIALSKPSLEEVFFRHTGRKMHEAHEQPSLGAGLSGRR